MKGNVGCFICIKTAERRSSVIPYSSLHWSPFVVLEGRLTVGYLTVSFRQHGAIRKHLSDLPALSPES